MGSVGTRFHRDCTTMGDAAKSSPRVSSTCAQDAFLSLLIIHIIQSCQICVGIDNPHSCCLSLVVLLEAMSGNWFAQLTMIPMLKTSKATPAGAGLTCTNFETGSKLHGLSGIVVITSADQCSTKGASSFRCLILNSRCSCHGK